jgi:hypothetical protein
MIFFRSIYSQIGSSYTARYQAAFTEFLHGYASIAIGDTAIGLQLKISEQRSSIGPHTNQRIVWYKKRSENTVICSHKISIPPMLSIAACKLTVSVPAI